MNVYRRPCGRGGGALLLLLTVFAPACRQPPPPRPPGPELVRATRLLLGATVSVTAVARDADERERAVRLADQALAEARRVERATAAAPRTLEQVQRAAGQAPIHLGEDLFRLLSQALRHAELTGGAYDPTAGVLRDLHCGAARPTAAALKAQLGRVGYGQVRLTPQPPGVVGTVKLRRAGMRIELDELWRPYAVDRAAQVLAQGGLGDFLVEAGSVAAARGAPPDGPWRVAVDDPDRDGAWLARLFLKDGAIALDGAAAGVRPAAGCAGSVVDPRTGLAATGVTRVAIVAPDAVGAAALARAVVVLGPAAGPALLRRLGREGIVARPGGDIWISDGLRGAAILRPQERPAPAEQ